MKYVWINETHCGKQTIFFFLELWFVLTLYHTPSFTTTRATEGFHFLWWLLKCVSAMCASVCFVFTKICDAANYVVAIQLQRYLTQISTKVIDYADDDGTLYMIQVFRGNPCHGILDRFFGSCLIRRVTTRHYYTTKQAKDDKSTCFLIPWITDCRIEHWSYLTHSCRRFSKCDTIH